MKKIISLLAILLITLSSSAQKFEAGFSYSGASLIPYYNTYGIHLNYSQKLGARFEGFVGTGFSYNNQYYVENFLPDTIIFGVPDPTAYRWVTTITKRISVDAGLLYNFIKKDNVSVGVGPIISWNYLKGTQHYQIYNDTYITPQYYKLGAGAILKLTVNPLISEKMGIYCGISPWYLFSSTPLGDEYYDPFVYGAGFLQFNAGVSYKPFL